MLNLKTVELTTPSQSYTHHDPILIESNADFSSQGFPGDGSLGSPYIIEWLEFNTSTDSSVIEIRDTDAYFIIRNCSFINTDPSVAVNLLRVKHGEIAECTTSSSSTYGYAIWESDDITFSGITLEYGLISFHISDNCAIRFCDLGYGPGAGVTLDRCNWVSIYEVRVYDSTSTGIYLLDSWDCTIRNCVLESNFDNQIEISGDSEQNVIYNNSLSGGTLSRALDNGDNNNWNSGTTGNWWSDYDGSGYYYIPGTAGSVDHYPRGPSATTSSTTGTSNTTTSTTTTETQPTTAPPLILDRGEMRLIQWVPMEFSARVLIVVSVVLIYGAVAFIVLLRRFRK